MKRLSFKDDTANRRGIRIIPRTVGIDGTGIKAAEKHAKDNYGVGGSGRVLKPTIYLSLSRLYPLGEKKDVIKVKSITKQDELYKNKADEKFQEWYNKVLPNVLQPGGDLLLIEKGVSSRATLNVKMMRIPTLSQSVGQDNLGNIISALVDIYMLSLQIGYTGAIVCIDEIDVSLHPDTQIKLFDLLLKLAEKLNVQFVVSSHSLTVLEYAIKKEKSYPDDCNVVYLVNPSAPYVMKNRNYELLKADLFGQLHFQKPRAKIYFEDEKSKLLFDLLLQAYEKQTPAILDESSECSLRNAEICKDIVVMRKRVKENTDKYKAFKTCKCVITHLGCDELFKVSNADESYFKRVIFLLDGDARYKDKKLNVKDYLEIDYNSKGQSDREHGKNICFLPTPFAPESFLYRIIYRLTKHEYEHLMFWRTLECNEDTSLYTASKIREAFATLSSDFNNDELKKYFSKDIWEFIDKARILDYYYGDCGTVNELLDFIDSVLRAHDYSYPIMLSNRYS